NLNFVPLDPDWITADLDPRIIRPHAVGDAKAPGVPRAGHDAFIQVAAAEGGTHVRAHVVDGKVLALIQKNRNELFGHFAGPAFAFGNVAPPPYRDEIRHFVPFSNPIWTTDLFAIMILP